MSRMGMAWLRRVRRRSRSGSLLRWRSPLPAKGRRTGKVVHGSAASAGNVPAGAWQMGQGLTSGERWRPLARHSVMVTSWHRGRKLMIARVAMQTASREAGSAVVGKTLFGQISGEDNADQPSAATPIIAATWTHPLPGFLPLLCFSKTHSLS